MESDKKSLSAYAWYSELATLCNTHDLDSQSGLAYTCLLLNVFSQPRSWRRAEKESGCTKNNTVRPPGWLVAQIILL